MVEPWYELRLARQLCLRLADVDEALELASRSLGAAREVVGLWPVNCARPEAFKDTAALLSAHRQRVRDLRLEVILLREAALECAARARAAHRPVVWHAGCARQFPPVGALPEEPRLPSPGPPSPTPGFAHEA